MKEVCSIWRSSEWIKPTKDRTNAAEKQPKQQWCYMWNVSTLGEIRGTRELKAVFHWTISRVTCASAANPTSPYWNFSFVPKALEKRTRMTSSRQLETWADLWLRLAKTSSNSHASRPTHVFYRLATMQHARNLKIAPCVHPYNYSIILLLRNCCAQHFRGGHAVQL